MHEVNAPTGERLQNGEILSFSQAVDLSGRFWAEPEVLAGWIGRINDITLSTMSLGALSHQDEQVELSNELVEVFQLVDKPIRTDVLNAGIMYGALVARDSSALLGTTGDNEPNREASGLVIGEIGSALHRSGISAYWDTRRSMADSFVDPNRSAAFVGKINPTFMLLREMEVEFLHSDVLATTLAVAQDHILNQVYSVTDFEDDDERASVARDAQVLFYAGALSGAIQHFMEHGGLPNHLPPIQLHRGMKDNDIVFASILEYEGRDDVTEIISYALENKYDLRGSKLGKSGRHKVVGVFPNGVQCGPNGVSLTIAGVTQHPWQTIDYKDVKHLILRSNNDKDETVEYRVVKATDEAFEDGLSGVEKSRAGQAEKLAGIVCKDNLCISAIDIGHPHAVDLDTFISEKIGIKPGDIKYANELQHWEIMGIPRQLRKLGLVCLAGTLGPWAFEAVDRFVLDNGDLAATMLTSGGVGLLGLSTVAVKRALTRVSPIERYDRIYHQNNKPASGTAE